MHHAAQRGFSRGAGEYERGRPGYPPQAISLLADELQIEPGRRVLDLAAGTGKLTSSLIALGAHVVAVEPVAEMREQLVRAAPQAEVLDGTAEKLPLAAGSVDVVLVAQAFHWFDAAAAATEIHRVLAPGGGGLGVLWNAWDESVPWVARVQDVVHVYVGGAPRAATSSWREILAASGLFTPIAARVIPHLVPGGIDALLARVSSVSYISALPERERERVLEAVRAIVATDPQVRGRGQLEMPYLTHVLWCHST